MQAIVSSESKFFPHFCHIVKSTDFTGKGSHPWPPIPNSYPKRVKPYISC